jgi:signal transduction histidine kinase
MKRTTLETADGATTKVDARNGASNGARFPPLDGRASQQLTLLAECAEVLLADGGGFAEVFAKLSKPLELDAYVCFVAGDGEPSLTAESAGGLPELAVSASTIEAMAGELAHAGQRLRVIDCEEASLDRRAAIFRDLGFASAILGVLRTGEHVLGAVVLASRSKHHYSEGERTLLEAAVCVATAAFERRELIRHRESSEQRKREFLTVLAHELRNPLAPVRNALEIIRTNDRGARSPVEYSAYAMIERQLQQIGRLADDLLDANQVVLGEVELERQRVLLDAIIERAASQSRPWIDAARHTLLVDLPRDAIALDADPKRLARVFSNLVNNAARRMDRGGRIVISAELRGDSVAVFVRAGGQLARNIRGRRFV